MATGVQTQPRPAKAEETQRSRLVWMVLAGTSLAFLFICMLGIMAVSTFVNNDTVAMAARIEPLRGTQLAVLRHNSVAPELITSTTQITEGDVATTGGDSSAFLQMFDGSTIQTYFSTTLEIENLRTGRYKRNIKEISVNLRSGTAIMVTADPDDYDTAAYKVSTDSAEISLASNSKARVRIEPIDGQDRTTVVVDYGEAVFVANGETMRITPGQMVWVAGDETPVEQEAREELIRNGQFTDDPTSGAEITDNGGLGTAAWLPIREGSDVPVDDPGTVILDSEDLPGRGSLKEVRFERNGLGDHFVKVGIRQEVNRPATFLNSIELFAIVRVDRQTTPIGGPQGNLYPLTIRVIYADSEGVEHDWKQQFYFVEGQPDASEPRQTGSASAEATPATTPIATPSTPVDTPIEQGIWWAPTKPFVLKSPDEVRDIAVIRAVEVFAYGSQFQSWIAGISMVAR